MAGEAKHSEKVAAPLLGLFVAYICDIKFFGRIVCFNWPLCEKGQPFSQSRTTYSNKRLLRYFQTKTFFLNPILQIGAIVLF